jgi:hypothetical protein
LSGHGESHGKVTGKSCRDLHKRAIWGQNRWAQNYALAFRTMALALAVRPPGSTGSMVFSDSSHAAILSAVSSAIGHWHAAAACFKNSSESSAMLTANLS